MKKVFNVFGILLALLFSLVLIPLLIANPAFRAVSDFLQPETVEQVAADDSGMASYALVRPKVQLERLIEVFIIKEFDIVE